MKTVHTFMLATGIAALIAAFFAFVPVLFLPAYGFWVVAMLLMIAFFEYRGRIDRHHY